MRMSRIYCSDQLVLGARVELAPDRAHYVQQVLRLKPGAALSLFNAGDGEFAGVIEVATKKQVVVTLGEPIDRQSESPLHIHLGQGLSRGERMDYCVQKAAELGVNTITPLFTEHCVVRLAPDRIEKKRQHWQNIAISACEQCGRTVIPEIASPMRVNDWIAMQKADMQLVCHHEAGAPLPQASAVKTVSLLIGPEGGLSPPEVTFAKEQGFHPWLFGPRVLRTETAPVAAISLLQAAWGDF